MKNKLLNHIFKSNKILKKGINSAFFLLNILFLSSLISGCDSGPNGISGNASLSGSGFKQTSNIPIFANSVLGNALQNGYIPANYLTINGNAIYDCSQNDPPPCAATPSTQWQSSGITVPASTSGTTYSLFIEVTGSVFLANSQGSITVTPDKQISFTNSNKVTSHNSNKTYVTPNDLVILVLNKNTSCTPSSPKNCIVASADNSTQPATRYKSYQSGIFKNHTKDSYYLDSGIGLSININSKNYPLPVLTGAVKGSSLPSPQPQGSAPVTFLSLTNFLATFQQSPDTPGTNIIGQPPYQSIMASIAMDPAPYYYSCIPNIKDGNIINSGPPACEITSTPKLSPPSILHEVPNLSKFNSAQQILGGNYQIYTFYPPQEGFMSITIGEPGVKGNYQVYYQILSSQFEATYNDISSSGKSIKNTFSKGDFCSSNDSTIGICDPKTAIGRSVPRSSLLNYFGNGKGTPTDGYVEYCITNNPDPYEGCPNNPSSVYQPIPTSNNRSIIISKTAAPQYYDKADTIPSPYYGRNIGFATIPNVSTGGTLYFRVHDSGQYKNTKNGTFSSDYNDNFGNYLATVSILSETVYPSWFVTHIALPVMGNLRVSLSYYGKIIFDQIIGAPGSSNTDFQNIVRLMLTLFVSIYGAMFILGMTEISAKEFVKVIFKIAIVVMLLQPYAFDFFQNYLFQIFTDGSSVLSNYALNNFFGSCVTLQDIQREFNLDAAGNPISLMEQTEIYNTANLFCFVDQAISQFFTRSALIRYCILLIMGPLGIVILAIIVQLFKTYIKLILQGVIGYLVMMGMIYFLIAIFPLFLILVLFAYTRRYFWGWLNYTANYAMQPVLFFTFFAVMNSIITYILSSILDFQTSWSCWLPIVLDLRIILSFFCPIASFLPAFYFELFCIKMLQPQSAATVLIEALCLYIVVKGTDEMLNAISQLAERLMSGGFGSNEEGAVGVQAGAGIAMVGSGVSGLGTASLAGNLSGKILRASGMDSNYNYANLVGRQEKGQMQKSSLGERLNQHYDQVAKEKQIDKLSSQYLPSPSSSQSGKNLFKASFATGGGYGSGMATSPQSSLGSFYSSASGQGLSSSGVQAAQHIEKAGKGADLKQLLKDSTSQTQAAMSQTADTLKGQYAQNAASFDALKAATSPEQHKQALDDLKKANPQAHSDYSATLSAKQASIDSDFTSRVGALSSRASNAMAAVKTPEEFMDMKRSMLSYVAASDLLSSPEGRKATSTSLAANLRRLDQLEGDMYTKLKAKHPNSSSIIDEAAKAKTPAGIKESFTKMKAYNPDLFADLQKMRTSPEFSMVNKALIRDLSRTSPEVKSLLTSDASIENLRDILKSRVPGEASTVMLGDHITREARRLGKEDELKQALEDPYFSAQNLAGIYNVQPGTNLDELRKSIGASLSDSQHLTDNIARSVADKAQIGHALEAYEQAAATATVDEKRTLKEGLMDTLKTLSPDNTESIENAFSTNFDSFRSSLSGSLSHSDEENRVLDLSRAIESAEAAGDLGRAAALSQEFQRNAQAIDASFNLRAEDNELQKYLAREEFISTRIGGRG